MIKGKTLVFYEFYWGEVMEGLSLKVWMYHLLPLQTQRNFSLCMQLPDSDLSKLAGPQAVGFMRLIFGHILDTQ